MKDQIKQALKSERYNFTHLADHMGYTRVYVSNVLNKKYKAPKRFFFLLCASLNDMTGSNFKTSDFEEYIK